jgi:hypothetical protein
MKKFFSNIVASLNTEAGGFSARKLSAFFGVVFVAGWITHKNADASNVTELVLIWLSFSMLCLGLVTIGQLVELRTGVVSKKETKTVTETKSETNQP